MTSSMITFSGIAHVAVAVRDMQTSVDWYQRVLGFEPASEVREGPPEAPHPRILLKHPDSGLVLGVHEPIERSGDEFDPSRTSLDHFALAVANRAALDEWLARLAEVSAGHSPVRDAGHAEFTFGVRPGRNPVGAVSGETV